jgi:hypothetical protein
MRPAILVRLLLSVLLAASLRAATVPLAENGRARLPIVTSPQAAAQTQRAATELATLLGRISGSEFSRQTAVQPQGIVLGTAQDFPGFLAASEAPADRENYLLRSEGDRLLLITVHLGEQQAALVLADYFFQDRQ